jgi:succinoglycan biosynthesis transport protein ExoP
LNERYFRVGEQVGRELKMKFLGYLPFLSRSDLASIRRGKGAASTLAMSKVPEAESFMHFAQLMPDSPFAETLRGAKLAIDQSQKVAGARVVGTASILPGEGKSTVAGNLAELLAANGARTLLIDADLRNPEVSRRLVPGVQAGLIEVLKGQPWQNVLQADGASTLVILPALQIDNGGLSSQFLSSDAMRQLIDEARRHFDYIIVDLPPLGATVDARAVEPLLDTVLLIAEWGRTPRGLLKSFFGTDDSYARKIAGVVLNKTRMSELPKYAAWGSAERYFGAYGLQG